MRKTIPAFLAFALALALTLCLASAAPSQAGRERVRFEHLSTRQGLSRAVVYDILQDSRGFMWFALEGALNRYDGISFRVYEPDPDNENSIGSGSVSRLFEDSRQRLWIGTRKGLNRFDPETETFKRYTHDPDDPDSIGSDMVLYGICEDRDGILWVGTRNGGLNRFDPETEKFSAYRHDGNDPESINSDDVTAVCTDPQLDSILWVGTDKGLARMDTESGRFERFRHDPADESTLSHDHVMAIASFPETGNAIWIGTMGGLNRFDPDSGAFRRYVHDPSDPRSLGYDPVYDVCYAGDGKLWASVHGGGLCRMDIASETFETFAHDPSDPYSPSNNDTHPLLVDRVGALWVGSWGGGADRYDPDHPKFTLYRRNSGAEGGLAHSSVLGMLEDREGFVWIGSTGGGLTRFDPSTERFSNFRHDPDDPDSLIHDTVFVLREDSEGTLWVGTWGGLDRFDRETGVFAHYLHDERDENSLSHNAVRGIREDAEGFLWIATTFGGINRLDPKTGRFARYAKEPGNPGSLSDNNVWCLFIDCGGTLWAGASQALNRFDPETETFVHYRHDPKDPNSISDDLVINMHEDRDGVLWLATPAGLNRMDRKTGRFSSYTVKDGLPHNTVESIVEDDRGFLWLSTDKGVSKFDPREETFVNYDVSDGLQGDKFYGSAYLKTRDGEIYFGGPDGLNRFHPDRIRNNPHPPPVVLTDFLVFNESAPIGPDALLPKQVGYVDEIVLYPRHFRFAFEFAALNYAAPRKNRYAYMLEGFDKDWTFANSERRFATYTNLNPGQYVFRVKASNNDGVWNEEGASVRVVVRPAWWNTWAFRSFLALAAGCLLFGGYRWRVRSVEERSRELAEMVRARTMELSQKGEELGRSNERMRAEIETRVRAEKRLRFQAMLLEQIKDHIVATDPEGRVTYVNRAAADSLKRPPEQLIGETVHAFGDDSAKGATQDEIVSRTLKDGAWQGRVANCDLEGRQFILEIRTWTLASSSGRPDGMVGIATDVTRQVKAEADLKTAKEAAEAANRAKSRFLLSMSHELRTPLNAILGYAQLYKDRRDIDGSFRESMRVVHESGKHLLSLIDEVLDLTRIETGKMELSRETTNLAKFLENVAGIFRQRAKDKGIGFVYRATGPLPEWVETDRLRLRQVLINLLGNAVKFTEKGSVTFRVDCREPDSPGQAATIVFEIEDTGVGIPPEQLASVFEPFEQACGPFRKTKGIGLGLHISRQIVGMMGGDIEVESEPGKGSRFRFQASFPAAEPPEDGDIAEKEKKTIVGHRGGKRKILIVDDTAANRFMLRDTLESAGFSVCEAENAGSGFMKLLGCKPDLVLMDLVMPGIDGFRTVEILRRLRTEAKDVPVVAVSASFLNMAPDEIRQKGFDAFVGKPVDIRGLFDVLQRLLSLEWIYRDDRADHGAEESAASPKVPDARETPSIDADVFDLETALANMDGDREMLDNYLTISLEDMSSGMEKLRDAAESGDAKAAMTLAHGIKTMASTLCAERFRQAALAMEQASEAQDLEGMRRRLGPLRDAWDAFRSVLETKKM